MTDKSTIDVLVVGPVRHVRVERVAADYRVFNHLVGGSISMLRLPSVLRERGYAAYCDDDAVARGQVANSFNVHLGHWRLLGPVVFFKDDGEGNEVGLTPDEVRYLVRYLSRMPSLDSLIQAETDRQFWAEHPSGMAFRSYETLDELFKDAGID